MLAITCNSTKPSLRINFSGKRKGSVEEGFNLLIGVVCFVMVMAFLFYFLNSSVNKFEEQAFLDSASKLQYAMDYACKTKLPPGEVLHVEVKMPQKVGNAADWIAGWGDPQYVVYYERFPAGEDWTWTTLRLVNFWASMAESALLGVAMAAPAKIGKGLEFFGYLEEDGLLRRLSLKMSTKVESAATWALDNLDLIPSNAFRKMVYDIDIFLSSSKLGARNAGKVAEESRGILRQLGKEDLIKEGDEAVLEFLRTLADTSKGGAVKDATESLFRAPLSKTQKDAVDILANDIKKSYLDADAALDVANKLKTNLKNNPEAEKLATALEDHAAFLKGNNLGGLTKKKLDGSFLSHDDVLALVQALKHIDENIKYIAFPRNLILPAIAEHGKWVGNNYIFDSLLSPWDRANEKLRFCGVSSLCAKTLNYIAVYKLKGCEDNGYEYVRLKLTGKDVGLDTSGAVEFVDSIGGTIAGSWNNVWTSGSKRFYLASPCGRSFKIYTGKCQCYSEPEPVYTYNFEKASANRWELKTEFAGNAKICDEPITDASGAVVGNGKMIDVNCLIVEPENSLEGYSGKGNDYGNFCYSRPAYLKQVNEYSVIIGSVLIYIGADALTSGAASASLAFGAGSNMVIDFMRIKLDEKLYWPNG